MRAMPVPQQAQELGLLRHIPADHGEDSGQGDAHLPTAAIPTRWALVEEFKLTERGKLDRKHLPEPLLTASTHVSSDQN